MPPAARLRRFQRWTKSIVTALQWCLTRPIALLLWCGDKRRAFPAIFSKTMAALLVGVATAVVTLLGMPKAAPPHWWGVLFQLPLISYASFHAFAVSGITSCLTYLSLRVTLPLMFYIPHAMAMRNMGLLEARVQHDGGTRCLSRLLKHHDDDVTIKVICISGRKLFTEEDSPLHGYAQRGRLMVLMPSSKASNPTVLARHAQYDEKYVSLTYPRIDDLLREMDVSKGFLKVNGDNKLAEHEELCMWRIVLLSHCCLVQNYFPNHTGRESNHSPVFVFEKPDEDSQFSYYATFEEMFYLLSGFQKKQP